MQTKAELNVTFEDPGSIDIVARIESERSGGRPSARSEGRN
jgi:hypothetical protein